MGIFEGEEEWNGVELFQCVGSPESRNNINPAQAVKGGAGGRGILSSGSPTSRNNVNLAQAMKEGRGGGVHVIIPQRLALQADVSSSSFPSQGTDYSNNQRKWASSICLWAASRSGNSVHVQAEEVNDRWDINTTTKRSVRFRS